VIMTWTLANLVLSCTLELIDDDDEVLLVLGQELGRLSNAVGGPQYAHVLLPLLENLAAVEDASVREKVGGWWRIKQDDEPLSTNACILVGGELTLWSGQYLVRTTTIGALLAFTEPTGFGWMVYLSYFSHGSLCYYLSQIL
jgi:hypothetical protein